MTASPQLRRPRMSADPVFGGPGVKGESSESSSDAVGAFDAWSGDHTIEAAGKAQPTCESQLPGAALQRRFLSVEQAAGYLNVSERFMRGVVAARRVRFHKVGKFLRFEVADLDALLETHEVGDGLSELADRVWLSARRLG